MTPDNMRMIRCLCCLGSTSALKTFSAASSSCCCHSGAVSAALELYMCHTKHRIGCMKLLHNISDLCSEELSSLQTK